MTRGMPSDYGDPSTGGANRRRPGSTVTPWPTPSSAADRRALRTDPPASSRSRWRTAIAATRSATRCSAACCRPSTARAKAECRAAIIRAEPGSSTWSAGYDISALPVDGSDPLTWTNPLEAFLHAVRSAPFPVIAAVEGGVWGGACELVMTCDLVVAVRSATFAITPARLGVPYNTAGVAHFLSALPLNVAKEMFFTADPITAETAAAFGVVNRLVDDGDEMTETAVALGPPDRHAGAPGHPRDQGGDGGAHRRTVAHERRLRAAHGTASRGLDERRLPGGRAGLHGEAVTTVQRQLSEASTFSGS